MPSLSRHVCVAKKGLVACLVVLLSACAPIATEPPAPAVKAEMEFPSPGTKWVTRTIDQSGATWTTTWTVLDEGTYKGKAVYRISDSINIRIFDKGTRNWIATLREDEEVFVASPHNGLFSWPLWVGKRWFAQYAYDDRQRGRHWDAIETFWKVEAYEEVTSPAGTFKAFRLQSSPGRHSASLSTIWYAPEPRVVIKEIFERTQGHLLGPGKFMTELLQYSPPGGAKWYGVGFEAVLEAISRGEAREALSYYEQQVGDLERRGLRLEAAQAHMAVMWGARSLGLYQKGIRAGLHALDLLKIERRTEDIRNRLANIYFTIGNMYRLAGDFQEAQRYQQEGADLSRGFTNERSRRFWSANFARGLAYVAYARGDYPLALQQGNEAIRLLKEYLAQLPSESRFDQRFRDGQRNLGWSLVIVGNAHRRMGNLTAAESSLTQTIRLARELQLTELETSALTQLGWTALAERDPSRALGPFEEALTLATRLNHALLLMWIHAGIARSYSQQGRVDEALAAFRRSIELVEDVRSQLHEAGLRSGFVEDKEEIYHGAVRSSLAIGKLDEAFNYAERVRARAFLDLLGSQTVLSKGKTQALVEEEARLRAQLSEAHALAQEVERGDRTRARQQVEAAQQAYRAFLDRVRKESLEQASLLTVEPVTLREIQRLLPEGTTLLEYLVTELETILWVIDHQRAEVVHLPVPRQTLVSQVRQFRRAIEELAPLERVREVARALHELLLGPARPHLRGGRLLIVPHDVLHFLPFSALRTPEGRWLVEQYTIATLPSASVLKYLQGKGQGASDRALAVGNPDLGPTRRLRYAEQEARAVGDRFPQSWVLVRQEATKAKVKALAGEAGLLHFATHGELSEEDPLSSALLLMPEGTDDGRLEVREIFGLDLKARLVVLSACETGLGKLSKGDELVGLQRAFLYAGTPAVVTTLWKVDDRASYLLIREFYAYLHTRGPAEALRLAQGKAMADFPHPFYWAGFGLTGVPR